MDELSFLSGVSIFSSLGEADRGELARLWNRREYARGETIFHQDDAAGAMYLVQHGEIAISVATQDHQELVVSVMGHGEFFGELAMLDGSPRSATAKVTEPATLLEMRRESFLEFLRSRPDVAISMMAAIAARLRTTNELLERRVAKNVNDEIDQHYSFGDRIADRIAEFGGSWSFLAFFAVIVVVWIVLNVSQLSFQPFDPFPFIFLNLVLNCICAVQAPVIMMSQNRQSAKDRLRADLDYQLNVKMELQLQGLQLKVDKLGRASSPDERVHTRGA